MSTDAVIGGDLSQAEASEILGISERTFRRWRERYEAEGAAGLYDRRLGRVSARRAPVDEVMRVLELFETRYPDFTAKHFHEKLVCEHGFGLSYNWLRLSLQAHGKIKPAPRRGAHRRKRPRRPVVGMMLHQDGSSHEWVAGPWWDLIVTMSCASPGSPPWPRPIAFSRSSSGRRTTPASPARPRTPARPSWLLPARSRDILCAQEDRVVAGDNTVRYKNRTLQIPADRHRHHYVKAQVRVHEYPDGHLAVFHGPRCLARYRADGETIDDDRLQAA